MPLSRVLGFRVVGYVLGLAAVVSAQAATHPRVTVQPQTRIVQTIDTAAMTQMAHTSPAAIAQAVDQGRLDAGTQFNHMMLVLKSSDEQEFALRGLLDQQQDKSSANYHQWATPESFGASFGVASGDLAKITAWLQDAGLTVESVAKGARIIAFSGTSGQVEAAFHTEMHRYTLNGEAHVANSVDISIPTALVSVVAGVSSLHNFDAKPNLVNPHRVVLGQDGKMYPAVAGTADPDYTSTSSGNHFVGASDLATIFDTKPLLAAGIDGTGQTIGIIGRTDILLSDVQIYRTLFNLPKNDPTFTQIGGDPGTIADDGESDLDVELAGALAPMANVNFVTSGDSYFGGGIDASALYLVENNNADILSLSYGQCEANLGSNGNFFYSLLWEQAAAQGQTVFVSSGDSGAATCDGAGAAYARNGYGVNGLGSTPFNVSVGGTMFNDGPATGVTPYWGPAAGAPYGTALSYIPEVPWNEGNGGTHGLGGLAAAGSGISLYYQTPSYQAGPGVPTTDPIVFANAVVAGPHRYLPDVSLVAAAAHDGTIFCSEGSCMTDSSGTVLRLGLVGGTSVATPVMASVQALINQKNGGRQGLANYYYYRVAAVQSQTGCIASTLPSTAGAGCAFHDIATGNTNVPSNAAGTTSIGFTAAPGYDLAVGLGSADVNNLATAWSTVSFNATTTTFTLTPTTGITHGAAQNLTISVAPLTGTGTPTGDVSIIANASYGAVGYYTLSSGSASGPIFGLPGGTYTVYAHYAGDSKYGGSNSAPVSVTISPEGSVLHVGSYLLATNGGLSRTTTYQYGGNVYLDAQVGSASNSAGTPTGKVTFTLTNGTSALPPVAASLDSFADAYYDAGLGFAPYLIAPTAGVLAPATYTVAASYAGDTTFNASSITPFTIVVGPANQAVNLRAVTADITSGGTATFNASITTLAAAAGGVPATGTVTFLDGATTLGTGTLVNGAVVFTTTALVAAGPHTITATYSGDGNYMASSSAAPVTVTVGGSATTLALAVSGTSVQVGTAVTLTATAPSGATGTVFFYDNGVSLGGANISTTTLTGAIAVTSFRVGAHSITATFSGNATLAGSSSPAMVIMVAQNTPTLQLSAPVTPTAGTTIAMNAVLIPSPAGSKPDNPAPTGLIQFLDGTTVMGTATAAYLPGGYRNYVASFNTPALGAGPHNFSASYVGDPNYAGAISNSQTGLIPLALVASATTVQVGTVVTFTAPAGAAGSVTFYDNGVALGTPALSGPSFAGVLAVTNFSAGSHSITATYTSSVTAATVTSAATAITVTPNTPTLQLAAPANTPGTTAVSLSAVLTPSPAGTKPNNPAPSGLIQFLDGTTVVGMTAPVYAATTQMYSGALTVSVLPGPHRFSANFVGDANYAAAAAGAQAIGIGLTTIVVSSSTPNVGTGILFTLQARVAPVVAASTAIGGTVMFLDGTTVIGTAPVNGGVATLTTATLTGVSTHVITAIYSGDANYFTSTTGTGVSVVTVAPTATLALNSNTLGIVRGQAGEVLVTLTTTGNYSGTAALTCSGLPALSTCSFGTPTLTFNGVNGSQTTPVVISTTASRAVSGGAASGFLWLPALLLGGLVARRRKQIPARARQMMLLAMLVCGGLAMTGCGTTSSPATPVGSDTVTITATTTGATAASPSTALTASLALTIQ